MLVRWESITLTVNLTNFIGILSGPVAFLGIKPYCFDNLFNTISFEIKVVLVFWNVVVNKFKARMMFIGFNNGFYSEFIIIGTLEFNDCFSSCILYYIYVISIEFLS